VKGIVSVLDGCQSLQLKPKGGKESEEKASRGEHTFIEAASEER
jgi:hypothetical protein